MTDARLTEIGQIVASGALVHSDVAGELLAEIVRQRQLLLRALAAGQGAVDRANELRESRRAILAELTRAANTCRETLDQPALDALRRLEAAL